MINKMKEGHFGEDYLHELKQVPFPNTSNLGSS